MNTLKSSLPEMYSYLHIEFAYFTKFVGCLNTARERLYSNPPFMFKICNPQNNCNVLTV